MTLDRKRYLELIEARINNPASLQKALKKRARRTVAGKDGKLMLLAADHTARGIIAAGNNPTAIADRYILLDKLIRGLAVAGVDGVMASADILEELAWLGALEEKVAIGTMNRGGIILSDNVLWSGKVLEPLQPNDISTKVLLEYNELLKNDPRVETVLLPIRDGLTVSRVL